MDVQPALLGVLGHDQREMVAQHAGEDPVVRGNARARLEQREARGDQPGDPLDQGGGARAQRAVPLDRAPGVLEEEHPPAPVGDGALARDHVDQRR